ncbi:MAG: glycerophosphodiester phosphodiesterase [Chloroflexi bacterium]|nr:glycerophosphodiester phosphodiesterase [Chloroflexota bacterium]
MTIVIAHRGASAYAPENTLKAFDLAADMGADMCELDVGLTADGKLAVFHDDTTGRWESQDRPIGQLTMAQMQQLDIRGERVPELSAVLDLARARGMRLNVELKHAGMAAKVLAAINDAQMHDAVIISSFYPQALIEIRQHDPVIQMGLLMYNQGWEPSVYTDATAMRATLAQFACQAWHPYFNLDQIDVVAPLVQAEYAVNVWTVNDDADMQRFIDLKVHGIITDMPDVLRRRL